MEKTVKCTHCQHVFVLGWSARVASHLKQIKAHILPFVECKNCKKRGVEIVGE